MLPVVQLDNKGLYTFPNQIGSQVPPGAMTVADNIDIDRTGIAETRRGFDFYGTQLGANAIKGYNYDQTLLWYQSNGDLAYDSDGAGTWVDYTGDYFPPSGSYLFSTQSSGNFYFTTNNGVYKLDSVTGTPRQSGVPGALDINGAISGAGNAVLNNSQVGYQVLFGYVDANSNLILGAPSEFLFITNTSGSTQQVTLNITIPNGVTTQYFVQVYRTANTNSATVPPGNTFQLAIEHQLTAGEITAHTVTLIDNIPDSLLGAFIYTADGQPFNFPNAVPPLALDLTTFQQMTFYVNYATIQNVDVTLDSVGAPLGLQIGDTFSITDIAGSTTYTYTGAAANNAAARQFKIDTSGTIAQNIDATARNLVAMINQDPTNILFYAYYITGENILPGAISIKAQNLQQGKFYVNSSRQTSWTPVIPATAHTYISSNNARPNGFLVSKIGQTEAVPLAFEYLLQAGTINIIIYRAIALQDAVYMFTNGGIFRVTGSDPTTLQTLLFDSSAILFGINTPDILNNSIYYFSTQGECSVSSGGNQIMSRNIERDLLILAALPPFPSIAFSCAYESDRAYFLFTNTSDNPNSVVQEYRYNWITQTHTLWTREATAAIVSQAVNKLFFADNLGNIFRERKSFTDADYADERRTVTINSTVVNPGHVGDTITLVSSVNVLPGDVIQQTVALTLYSTQVTSNDTITGILNVLDATGFTSGAAFDFRSINTSITYCPIHGGFSEYVKKYTMWEFYFSNANFVEIPVSMSSDWSPAPETVNLVPRTLSGWGTQPWGTFPWGSGVITAQIIPTWPTKNTNYAHWVTISLNLTQAFTSLSLDGISLTFDITSTRGR
jgi:hypothetical protein